MFAIKLGLKNCHISESIFNVKMSVWFRVYWAQIMMMMMMMTSKRE